MKIRPIIFATAMAATLPAAFAQAGPAAVRGEAGYPGLAVTAARQDSRSEAAASPAMPEYDFVSGDVGYVPHQHQFMERNALRERVMGNRGAASQRMFTEVQGSREIQQYQQAGN